eukprot:221462_1
MSYKWRQNKKNRHSGVRYGDQNQHNSSNTRRPRHKVTNVQSNWNTFKPLRFNLRSSSSKNTTQNGYTETVKKHKRWQDNKILNQSQSRYNINHKSNTAIITPPKPPRFNNTSWSSYASNRMSYSVTLQHTDCADKHVILNQPKIAELRSKVPFFDKINKTYFINFQTSNG